MFSMKQKIISRQYHYSDECFGLLIAASVFPRWVLRMGMFWLCSLVFGSAREEQAIQQVDCDNEGCFILDWGTHKVCLMLFGVRNLSLTLLTWVPFRNCHSCINTMPSTSNVNQCLFFGMCWFSISSADIPSCQEEVGRGTVCSRVFGYGVT